jgi:hypothetical protein
MTSITQEGEIPMKIDTVRLETTAIVSTDTLHKMKEQGKCNTYRTIRKDYNCYEYRVGNDRRLPLIKYTVENQKLSILVPSLPRLVTDSSMIPLNHSHLEQVFSALTGCLDELKIEAAHPSKWVTKQLDCYHDFQVGEANVPDYISALGKNHIARSKRISYDNESVTWKNSSSSHGFYNKHQACIDKGDTPEDIELSKGILRYEAGYKATELNRDARIPSLKFEDICKEGIVSYLLEKHFNMIPMTNLHVTTEGRMFEILTAKYGSSNALRLIGLVRALERGDLIDLSDRTIQRNLEMIRSAGLAPIIGMRRLEPLFLPSQRQNIIELKGHLDPGPSVQKSKDKGYRILPHKRKKMN